MKLIIFGASGGCGIELVAQAIERGHEVTAVARASASFDAKTARTLRGDVTDAAFVANAIGGHDAVLSALGLRRANPKNPWSKLVSPVDFASRTAEHIVAGMKHHGVTRVCAISAAGVAESAAAMNVTMKFLVATSKIGIAYHDLAVMEDVYAKGGVDYQCVRPTRLTDGSLTGDVRVVESFPTMAAISRADVAHYMLEQITKPRFDARLPTISHSM
jgi:putative NADH-flavin reductase